MVQAQRRQERLEQAADRIAATLRGTLAETGERLSAWLTTPPPAGKPDDGVLLTVEENSVTAYPGRTAALLPGALQRAGSAAEVFAEGELLEFLQAQPAKAADAYRALAESKNAAVRAGALLRLARVLGKLGRREESRAAYTRLAAIGGVRVAGAPAELVARHALGRSSRVRAGPAARALAPDARTVRVLLRRRRARRPACAGRGRANRPGTRTGARGQTTVWAGGHPFLVDVAHQRRAPRRAGGDPGASRPAKRCPAPRWIAKAASCWAAATAPTGPPYGRRRRASFRGPSTSAAPPNPPGTGLPESQRYLLLGMGVMVLFLIAGHVLHRARDSPRNGGLAHAIRLRLRGFARVPLAADLHPPALGDSGTGPGAQRRTPAGVLHHPGARDAAPAAPGRGAAEFRTHGGGRARLPLRRDRDREPGPPGGGRIRSATGGGAADRTAAAPTPPAPSMPTRTRSRSCCAI